MPKPEDRRPEGVGIYIRQIPVPMLQVINTTLGTIKISPNLKATAHLLYTYSNRYRLRLWQVI